MTSIAANAKPREATISAVIIRADGTREDLGVVCYWHKNPIKRWIYALRRAFGGRK